MERATAQPRRLLCLHQKRKLGKGADNELLNFQNVPETVRGTLSLIHVRLKRVQELALSCLAAGPKPRRVYPVGLALPQLLPHVGYAHPRPVATWTNLTGQGPSAPGSLVPESGKGPHRAAGERTMGGDPGLYILSGRPQKRTSCCPLNLHSYQICDVSLSH